MDYFIKASAILAIFYLFYKLILERETFFQSNRIFLIVGIISALIIPLIVIPIYTEQATTSINQFVYSEISQGIQEAEETFNWTLLIEYIYLSGFIFFGMRLLISLSALVKFIIFGNSEKKGSFKFIKTTKDITPFSFFNYIIYNPALFKKEELDQILTHEKVHAFQWHTFDVLISQTMTTIFWFNPFSWLYKKDVQQNLEFIADAVSQEQLICDKTYQKLLLKTSLANNQLALANNFYNSLIKKRIIMLQKNKSNNRNQWKFALILPLITAFIFTFNTKIVAQNTQEIEVKELKEVKKQKDIKKAKDLNKLVQVKEIHENIEAFIITKDTKDLDKIKQKLADRGFTVKFKNLKRNDSGEVTSIKIDLKSKTASANFSVDSETPIKPIKITVEEDGTKLSMGTVSGLHNTFFNKKGDNVFVIEEKHGDHEKHVIKEIKTDGGKPHVIEIKKEKNVWVTKDGNKTVEIITSGDKKKHEVIEIIHKDGEEKHEVIEIKTDGDHNGAVFISENKGDGHVKFELSDSENKPMIMLDGKEVPYKKIEDLDPNKIESMNILKGDSAVEKYGKKAEHGVIEIITKKK